MTLVLAAIIVAPGVAVAGEDSFVVSTSAGQLRGVPQKVIAESGTALAPPPTSLATAEQNGIKIAVLVNPEPKNASSAAVIAALRRVPAEELVTQVVPLFRAGLVGSDVDGFVIPQAPFSIFL